MIAVDTSALMAVLLDESEAEACIAAIEREDELIISAGTVAEALIVSARRGLGVELAGLIDRLGFDVISVTPASARRIAQAYEKWGKSVSPAGLNFGDCFAYEVAKEYGCGLLYVGDDFAKTDVLKVIGA